MTLDSKIYTLKVQKKNEFFENITTIGTFYGTWITNGYFFKLIS